LVITRTLISRHVARNEPTDLILFCGSVFSGFGLIMIGIFFFSSRRRHTISVSAFLLTALPICLIFKLAPSVCRMTFPILASLLVRLVVLLPSQLLRLSLATPSRWTPLALSVFLHCVVALLLTLL